MGISFLRHLRKPTTIVGLLALLCALYFLFAPYSAGFEEVKTIGKDARTFDVLSERFKNLAKEKGGVYAFQVLKMAQLPPNTDTHLLGHAIGDVFYTQKGLAGIADCTQDFRNACSHTIVIGALNEFGTGDATLKVIDDACKKAPGGVGAYTMCYHGLGHGVFAYFGYDIPKTVAYCKKMGTKEYNNEQFTQCVGGMIMELIGGGGHDHDAWAAAQKKYFPKNDPLAPCNSPMIPEETKGFCYLYLTPRMFEAAGSSIAKPEPDTFPKAFTYCESVDPKSRARDACFGGFGREFIGLAAAHDIRAVDQLDNSVYARASLWCDLAGSAEGKKSCLQSEVDSVFWGGENNPDAVFRFCDVAPKDLHDACLGFIADNINQYLRGAARSTWCAKLPETSRGPCTP